MGSLVRFRLATSHELTLGDFLERFAEFRGDHLLVSQPGGYRLTYREAAELVSRAAGALRERIAPGDRVLVTVPNDYRLLLSCLAVCRAGGVAVPVNPRMTEAEVAHVVEDAAAEVRIDDFDALARGGAPTPMRATDPRSVATLLYTSGTTGRPKGARLTHRGLVGDLARGAAMPELFVRRGCVTGMPVAHVAGMGGLLLLASLGMSVHLLPHFRPTDALDAIEQERPMMFVGVPTMYRMMLEAGAAERDLSSVRFWASGADKIPEEIVTAFQRFGRAVTFPILHRSWGRAFFVDGYGMVELAGGCAVRVFPPVGLPGGSLMHALPGYHVRLLDSCGGEVPRGEVGELSISGPGVMRGYHGRAGGPGEDSTDGGWLRTGDLGRARGFGFFELVGREKDVVKCGGFSVFSSEVERVLEEHPAIAEAAVFGRPDDRMGEVPVAVVRTRDGASVSSEALRAFAGDRLSDYKVPREITVGDSLPYTASGKIDKKRLRNLPVAGEPAG